MIAAIFILRLTRVDMKPNCNHSNKLLFHIPQVCCFRKVGAKCEPIKKMHGVRFRVRGARIKAMEIPGSPIVTCVGGMLRCALGWVGATFLSSGRYTVESLPS